MLVTPQQHHPIKSNQCSHPEFWSVEDRASEQNEDVTPDKVSVRDLPQQYVSTSTAQRFLRQIWIELQEWTFRMVNSAQVVATAAMNVLLLSVAAVVGVLAVLILFIRDQIMDKRAATIAVPARLGTLPKSGKQTAH